MADNHVSGNELWQAGQPITAAKMNNIENAIDTNASSISTNTSNIAANTQNIGTVDSKVTQAQSDIGALQRDISTVGQNSALGARAWAQVSEAIVMNGDTVTTSLDTRISNDEARIDSISTEISTARKGKSSLRDKIDAMDLIVSEFATSISEINQTFTEASNSSIYGNFGSVDRRMEGSETRIHDLETEVADAHQSTAFNRKRENSELDNSYLTLDARLEDGESRIVALQTEMANAHESTALGKTGNTAYTSIDERFEAIESELVGQTALGSRLDTIETDISGLSTGKVNKTDIAANLTTDTAGKVLDATQGKALKDMIGDGFDSSNTIADRINAIDNASSGTVHGLDTRISALETEVDMTNANSRIDLVETEVTNARTSTVIRTPGANEGDPDTDTTYSSLDARLEAIESNAATMNTNVNTRVDELENNIETVATELGMVQSGEIVNTNTRIDTIDADLNTAATGIKARLDAIDNISTGAIKNLQDADIELDERLDAIDGGTALTGTNLATRVTTLEGKDTIIVDYDGEHSNYTEEVPNISNPSENADYLIADDEGKYFYWRYFGAETGWQLVGGAGGSGNGSSSGVILSALPAIADGDPNIDYFIGNSTNGYIHYRFIAGENGASGSYIMILPKNLINDLSVDSYGGLVAHNIGDDQTNLLAGFYALNGVTYTPNYDPNDNTQLVSQTLQFTGTDGQPLDPIVIVGGGGSGGSVYTVRIETTTDIARSIPANSTDPVTVRAKVVMKQGADLVPGATATGYIQYRVYGASTWNTGDRIEVEAVEESLKYTIQNDTYFTVDVTKYLETDKTIQIRLVIEAHPESEEESVTRYQTYTVSKVNISIADESFDYASVKNSNFQFNYRCFGSGISKTVHFLVDGTDIVTPVVTSTHNTVLQQVIPMTGKSNGMHTFQVYFITNTGLESNRLNYYILYNTDNTREAPLIGAAAQNTTITDGDELIVNYSVSTLGSETTDRVEIELYTMDNGTKNSIQTDILTNVPNNVLADPPYSTFNYPKVIKEQGAQTDPDPITVYVTLTAYHGALSDSQTVQVSVAYLNTIYDLEPAGKTNLLFEYVPYGHSNNEANKETYNYTYTTVGGTAVNFTGTFNDFNWATDGYADGKCLTIGGGATLDINVPIFSNSFNGTNIEENVNVQDITQIGRTIEIDYEVQSATDLNDIIIDCMSQSNIGFQVTPQSCYLTNSSAAVEMDSSGFILNEDQVAAAYLTPGQRIHLVFVIEPWATDAMRDAAFDGEYHQSTNIYVNGEFANACPYNRDKNTGNLAGNNFSTNATISIGSDSCLIKLYSIKLYNRGLTQEQVLQNYKVAPVATRDKLTRMEENDILNNAGEVNYEKARTKYTCLLLTGPAPLDANNAVVPTISPFKGAPSPAGRRDKKTNELVGKTESGLTLTKPSTSNANGYTVEFDLQDTIPEGQAAYLGAVGSYCSSNNVQGTSSQKYPLHNLKVYLAKWQPAVEAEYEEQEVEDPETHEITTQQVLIKDAVSAGIAKVKYSLKGYDDEGKALGTEESTLCWKADYMSTDHANTFNANIADGLFNNRVEDGWPITDWDSKKYQNTVYGIRCLLFQKQGDNPPVFVGDGCLNNDKGNSKTYGLEAKNDDGNDTRSQKWEFTNNSEDLGYFKTDDLMAPMGNSIRAKNGFESCYPDEGDLKDDGLEPNYNHLQILLTWVSKRANYWDETDPQLKADKKAIFKSEFTKHFNLSHVLTYYLFSQYVALCDNRVKNMFLRSDNVKEEIIRNSTGTVILEGNNEPDALWSNYVDPTTGVTTSSYIDWETGENHSNFAIWEPVLYDLDSCFGVENVGLIKIRYDADWDYEWKGTPQFNGYNSVFWLMVEDSYKDEIAALALSLYNQNPGLNFRTFNQKQIIENQAQISPALTNQDMILKFDKPWSEGFINYAETPDGQGNYPKQTPLYKYLQRGSRAAQKSQFMQQRSMLLSSMYGADEFLNSSIKFRTGVPVGASGNVIGYEDDDPTKPIYGNGDLTETQITIKANQILYPGVAYGDNKPATRVLTNDGRVAANTSCTIQATSAVQGNDGIFIYGASVLTDIGDISKFKPLQLDVSAGVNLKRLIIGSNAVGYSNNTTNSITGLNKCLLLEEVNVRNLKQMSTLTLTSNGFIKEVYAAGSGIGTISLPQGGVLETIEYGANTTDITIVNQGRLTNFSYEDSLTNNYANVTRLWIENTPNVPIKEIITARLTPTTSSDGGLRVGGLRLVGINLNLGNDPAFLQLLTSDLIKGTYLTAKGGHTEGNTQTPYISGTITITSIRASLLAQLNSWYPDLTINATEVVNEFEIKYENYDGTLLYTDHGTNEDDLKDPVYDTNPLTGLSYIPMPTKPADVQYIYSFGTYDNQNRYRKFSGWIRKGTSTNPTVGSKINGSFTLVAVYPTTVTQQYTVSWYDGDTFIASLTENYGRDLSSQDTPIETGTLARVKSTGNGIKVFSGWSRPLGKLTGNINVYAQWQSSTINDSTESVVLSELTAADLYALSLTENATKQRLLKDQLGATINVPMGCDFNYTEGVVTTNLLGNETELIFEGTSSDAIIYNNITPLADNSDWTLAIDYKFLFNSGKVNFYGNEYVLASCYQNANSSIVGFKLSMLKDTSGNGHHPIQVTWGTESQIIDYAGTDDSLDDKRFFNSHRNIVVLRHNADYPTKLEIGFVGANTANERVINLGNENYGLNFGQAESNVTLTWENATAINTPLILGGNYNGATTTIENNTSTRQPAEGIIYWAKFWNADLGENNAIKLASWPHEVVPFYLTGYNGNNDSNKTAQVYAGSALSFAAAYGVGDRYYWPNMRRNLDNEPYFAWDKSERRTILNNVMYGGLPEEYRSVIRESAVVTAKKDASTNAVADITTYDYFFLSCMRELNPNAAGNVGNQAREANALWSSPWPWMIPANKTNVLGLYGSSTSTFESKDIDSYNTYLYRFLGHIVSDDCRMFMSSVDPTTINNLAYHPKTGANQYITVRSGDIWIKPNGASDIAYMYFTNDDIAKGVHVDEVTTNGGWKLADYWDLRSSNLNSTSVNENIFMTVTPEGVLNQTISSNQLRDNGRLLCPEFTI